MTCTHRFLDKGLRVTKAFIAPLWINGVRVPRIDILRLARDIRGSLKGLHQDTVVVMPKNPLVSVIARKVALECGLPYALDYGSIQRSPDVRHVYLDEHGNVGLSRGWSYPLLDDCARLVSTSGSTGNPETVVHSSHAIAFQARVLAERLGVGAESNMLLPIPVSHAYGASVVELWLNHNVPLIIECGDVIAGTLRSLLERRISTIDVVPSMLQILVKLSRRNTDLRAALSRLDLLNVGGDVLPLGLANEVERECGQKVFDGYGLSEAGPNVAISGPGVYKKGTVGLPLRGVEVRVDARDEVYVRSPSLLSGYLRGTNVVKQVNKDGWLRTGDLGSIDSEGYLSIRGRSKSAIIVNGKTIAPFEVEEAARASGVCEDVAVIWTRGQSQLSDRIHVFFIPGRVHTPQRQVEILKDVVRTFGAGPVVLRRILSFPRLPSGKIDKKALKESVS